MGESKNINGLSRMRKMERIADGIETRMKKLQDLDFHLDYSGNSIVIFDDLNPEVNEYGVPKYVKALLQ